MASNREERFRMRQRGAGTHKIKDVDFGLAFPTVAGTPLAQQASSRSARPRRTPQSNRQPPPSQPSGRTPATTQSRRAASSRSTGRKRKGPADAASTPTVQQNLSTGKRRKTAGQPDQTPSDPPQAGSSARATQSSHVTQPARQRQRPQAGNVTPTIATTGSGSLTVAAPAMDDEGLSYEPEALDDVQEESEDDDDDDDDDSAASVYQEPQPRRFSKGKRRVSTYEEYPDLLAAESSRSTMPQMGRSSEIMQHHVSQTQEEDDDDIDAEGDDEIASPPIQQPGPSTKPSHSSRPIQLPKRSNKRPKGQQGIATKMPRSRRPPSPKAAVREQPVQRKQAKPVPIRVHRLSAVRPQHDDESEPQAAPRYIRPKGVNAVDVLSQICREYVGAAVDLIQKEAEKARSQGQKGEYRRKRNAVEAFGQELDERCFEMTEALDNNFALSTRLRQLTKDKVASRDELLSVRAERQAVAYKIDAARRKHEYNALAAKEQHDLNSAVHDIELAVRRGQAAHDVNSGSSDQDAMGLEMLLYDVTKDASTLGQGGGLLNNVRDFNAFLERAAVALEGRI